MLYQGLRYIPMSKSGIDFESSFENGSRCLRAISPKMLFGQEHTGEACIHYVRRFASFSEYSLIAATGLEELVIY